MDLAKPSDWRMAARSPCLVLGKSCRGGCGNGDGDGDGDEMERAFTKHVAATVVAMVSGRRSDGGGERIVLRRVVMFLLAWCVWRALTCVVLGDLQVISCYCTLHWPLN